MRMRRLRRWQLHKLFALVERCGRGFAHVGGKVRSDANCKPQHDWKLLSVDLIAGLSRWSAVVRGAVDTGCRRNYSIQL